MAVVDERGRVFGRFNLVDTVVVVLLLGLVPLGYAAFVLFKTPPPRLISVEPSELQVGRNLRVTVHGENLRPYMRLSFGNNQGMSFLFNDPSTAQAELGDIPSGVYDVILYDQARERSRLPKALTIAAPAKPKIEVDLIGMLNAVPAVAAKSLTAGVELPGVGRMLRVGPTTAASSRIAVGPGVLVEVPVPDSVNVPATIRANCIIVQRGSGITCENGDVTLSEGTVIKVTTPAGPFLFQIDQVLAPTPQETFDVRVRFIGEREAVDQLRAGDKSVKPLGGEGASAASVLSAGPSRGVSSGLAMSLTVVTPTQVEPVLVAGDLAAREATLRLPLQRTLGGWTFAGRAVKVGGSVVFTSLSYELRGTVLGMTPVKASATASKDPR